MSSIKKAGAHVALNVSDEHDDSESGSAEASKLFSQVGVMSESGSNGGLDGRKKLSALALVAMLLFVALYFVDSDGWSTPFKQDEDADSEAETSFQDSFSNDPSLSEKEDGDLKEAAAERKTVLREERVEESDFQVEEKVEEEEAEAEQEETIGGKGTLSRHKDGNVPDWLAAANARAHTPSKLTAADHPADPCHNMRKAWEDMPYEFPASDRDMIIGAGEGATGTSYASNLVRKLGYKTAHWNHANTDGKTAREWKHVLAKLLNIQPYEREHFNFDIIPQKVDGIFDTPVANLFPYLFKAYPKAKVILTTRTPAQWVVSRTRRSYLQSYPSTYHRKSILDEMKDPAAVTDRKRPQATMLQYEMFNLMVRCIVPKNQLLELDVIETPNEEVIAKFDSFFGRKRG